MNFHKVNEFWVNTAVIRSSFPLSQSTGWAWGWMRTNCLTAKERTGRPCYFLFPELTPAGASKGNRTQAYHLQRPGCWVSCTSQDIGAWILTDFQVKMTKKGAIIWWNEECRWPTMMSSHEQMYVFIFYLIQVMMTSYTGHDRRKSIP